jgi:hypothetical protein
VARGTNADEARQRAREAKEHGQSASEAGVSTGASKQIEHHSKGDRKKEPTPRGGKS